MKAASDIYAPASGEVIEINQLLVDTPETINSDAYGEGWIFKLKMSDPNELATLLDASGYEQVVAEDA